MPRGLRTKWSRALLVAVVTAALATVTNLATDLRSSWLAWAGLVVLVVVAAIVGAWLTHDGDGAASADVGPPPTGLAATLRNQEQVLGTDHPVTLATRQRIADGLGGQEDYVGAVAVLEPLLRDRERVLGADHTETLRTRHDLAHYRGLAGDRAGAVEAYRELLPVVRRVFGPAHHRTLMARRNLADWQGLTGDPIGAESAYRELVPEMERSLGREHPDTVAARQILEHWRRTR